MLLSLALAGAVAVAAQAPAPRRAPSDSANVVVITGRVVADTSGDPIRNARVALSPEPPQSPVVLTDSDGAFRLTAPAGPYRLVVRKTGFAQSDVPATAPGGAVEVRLKRGAAIAGRIVDERGEPVAGVKISALKAESGQRSTAGSTAETDDRGEYRLGGLPDGAFVVGVTTPGAVGVRPTARIPEARTTYYPGAAAIEDAQAVRVQPGDERAGADIVVPADRLAGTPASLFDNRFLPRPPPVAVQLGVVTPIDRPAGSVRGRVAAFDGAPISLAHVYLFTGDNADSRMATTDEEGRFEVESIVAGPLLVSVVRPGYAQIESGRTLNVFQMGRAVTSPSPSDVLFGRRIDLAANESKSVSLEMARWGTLSGTITDEHGDPMQGVEVEALQAQYERGRRQLLRDGASRVTDDRGRYRLTGLAPGRYIVSAAVGQVASEDVPGYSRAYFPGTPNTEEAQYVRLELAQDVGFVNFSMVPGRTAEVSGVVLSPTGEPTPGGGLMLAASERSVSVAGIAVGARRGPNGTFVFPNVAPGEYVIQVYRGRPNQHSEGDFGSAVVSVNGADVTGVVVRMSSGSSVTGRFRFDLDDPSKTPKPSELELAALPVDFDRSPNNQASADIRGDWTFELSGLHGPRRLALVRTPPGLMLEEVRVNGADMTDRAVPLGTAVQSLSNVEVVLTDRAAELSGKVVDERARPIGSAPVILFSTDRQQWFPESRYLRRSVTDAHGGYRVAGLPPGTYFVSAVMTAPTETDDAWQDPVFLETLIPRATTVGVAGRQKAVLELRVRPR